MDSLTDLEALKPLPDPANYRVGDTIDHPFWEISSNPRRVVLRLVRAERTMRIETWELEGAVYLPSQAKVGMTEWRAFKIEQATRSALADQVTEGSTPNVHRQGSAEGIGVVRATYRKETAELVEPVWVDRYGRIR